MLISRTWHGAVPLKHGDAFAAYLEKTEIQGSRSIPGNAAAYVHRVELDAHSHFFLLYSVVFLGGCSGFCRRDAGDCGDVPRGCQL